MCPDGPPVIAHCFTIAALSSEFDSLLRDYRIAEAYTQQKNELVVTLSKESAEPLSLVIGVEPKFNYIYYNRRTIRAKKNSVALFSPMTGLQILSVASPPFERIMEFRLTGGRLFLVHLYNSASSNCYLTDDALSILESFKHDGGPTASLPPLQQRFDTALLADEKKLFDALTAEPSKTILGRIKSCFPFLGARYAAELCFRSGFVTGLPTSEITLPQTTELAGQINGLLRDLRTPDPRLYDDPDGGPFLAVVPLGSLREKPVTLPGTLNAGIEQIVGGSHRQRAFQTERTRITEALRKEEKQAVRALRAAEKEHATASSADDYEQTGRLIIASIHLLAKGMASATLRDEYGDGGVRKVQLDTSLTPAQNAERYFQKARHARLAGTESARRSEELRSRVAHLQEILRRVGEADSRASLDAVTEEYSEQLSKIGLRPDGREAERPPFRIFQVSGGLEVWVGKNSSNNDLLTTRYASPHDYWFHVRGAGGSHTVLKTRGREVPPREAVREAAGIAAYYSKMRNAGTVPVAYCERKYVRKPKGAASGSVTLEREEIIFVKPALP